MCFLAVIVFVLAVFWCVVLFFFFFKQKTAYEMRISDWSSDVCSSDLAAVDPDATVARLHAETAETTGRERAVRIRGAGGEVAIGAAERAVVPAGAVAAGAFAQVGRLGKVLRTGFQRVAVVVADEKIGRASCRERGCE